MRLMSFKLTTEQVHRREKTVTRRRGWWDIKKGDLIQPVLKSQGIPKGGTVEKIGGPIRVVSVRRERLRRLLAEPRYGRLEVKREGFGHMTRRAFVEFFASSHGIDFTDDAGLATEVNRIEFEYVD